LDNLLELRIEQFKRISNIQHKLLKSFYDGRSVVERYLDGSIAIHIHLFTRNNHIFMTTIKSNASIMSDSCKSFVFVGVGESFNEFRPIASIVRLQPLKHCNVFPCQSPKVPFLSLEVLFRIYNDKLRLLYDTLGIITGQLIDQVIQSFSQGLYNVPNNPSGAEGGRIINGSSGSPNSGFQAFPFDINDSFLVIQGNFVGPFTQSWLWYNPPERGVL